MRWHRGPDPRQSAIYKRADNARNTDRRMSPDFLTLYHAHKDRVFSLCLHCLRERELAEEAAQDIFLKVYRSLDDFRGESDPKTWIYRIAVRHCLDVQKAQRRKKRLALVFSFLGGKNENRPSEPAHYEHPGLELEQREALARLLDLIDALPERQRTALVLSKIEGLAQKEIAAVMQIGEGAVEALLHRAKDNLRKKLDENER